MFIYPLLICHYMAFLYTISYTTNKNISKLYIIFLIHNNIHNNINLLSKLAVEIFRNHMKIHECSFSMLAILII